LVSDAGVIEPVINLTNLVDGANIQATTAKLPAGMPIAQALRTTIRSGLAGLVWSTGLPGTIGGAVAGNAGCWGGEMADVVARIDLIDANGKWQTLENNELTWSYRRLQLPATIGPSAVIVSATVNLHPEDSSELTGRSYKLQQLKRTNQPIGVRNTGCIFKNPNPNHSAGWLIEQAACKGIGIGKAQVSTLHGNFLINRGGATFADIETLITRVQTAVQEQSGIALEEEICRW
jgi:UDP-N-acetylmuramate dehydrogenase|tara:strand:- start:1273 stop:1974 length:702 start_codon:yes stop_codon:yes gene_type:complete